jgi:LacI family transcriptional regulator
MQKRRATLKDVAEKAGASVATASRAISGSTLVAEETRLRVLEAASSLNYQPNLQARALRRRASRVIGLVLPNLANAYYTALADTISQNLAQRGYHLLLAPTSDDAANETETLYDMVGQNVAGLIVVPSAMDTAMIGYLAEHAVPVVAVVRRVPDDAVDTVTFEDFEGAYAATRYLITLGHRRIGYIGGDDQFSSNHARWQGYAAALRDLGVPVDEQLVKIGQLRGTWGALACLDLLKQPPTPTAIFAASNAVMPGVISTLRSHRVAIPGQMSLICFDDVDWFAFTEPSITAISSSQGRLTEAAITLLLERIERPDTADRPPVLLEIDFALVVRGSTSVPPVDVATPRQTIRESTNGNPI